MITKDLIRKGIESRCIELVIDPNMESGTVCKIGDNWFYFGGLTAEELSPKDYVLNVPEDDIINEIFETLDDFRKSGVLFADEYAYYESILCSI